MIVLDTNVVSEPMKLRADPAVIAWLTGQAPETLYLTATSLAELLIGIEIMPIGKRRDGSALVLRRLLDRLFGPRVLAFDERAAVVYAERVAQARTDGFSISVGDGQIASVAIVAGFPVATRDTGPFVAAGVKTINPWTG